jgi:hypothetical protein
VIACSLEDRQAACGLGDDLLRVGLGVGRMGADTETQQAGARGKPVLARGLRGVDRLVEDVLRVRELANRHQRLRQVGEERQAVAARCRQKRRPAAEEVRGGGHVAAGERPAPRRHEAVRRPGPELASVLVEGAELGEGRVRLLEVVAQDLLVLDGSIRVHAVRPVHEALVEDRAGALEKSPICRVPDEEMAEAVAPLEHELRLLGPDKLFP